MTRDTVGTLGTLKLFNDKNVEGIRIGILGSKDARIQQV
jgi:hypothetical protein